MNKSEIIPVFPLSGAFLLPSGNLPLNIFEPRYVDMVDYAFKKNKLIGMIQPKNQNSTELFKIGCIGKITSFSETQDKRYLINLYGLSRFKIIKEVQNEKKFKTFEIKSLKKSVVYHNLDDKLFNSSF